MPRKNGIWWFKSELDSRWNTQGEGIVGFGTMPPEAVAKLVILEDKYGPRPDDLVFGYMKD